MSTKLSGDMKTPRDKNTKLDKARAATNLRVTKVELETDEEEGGS